MWIERTRYGKGNGGLKWEIGAVRLVINLTGKRKDLA